MNDVDLARQMKLLAEDAEDVRKELVGGTARGLTPGLHQALKNLLQSAARVRATYDGLMANAQPAPSAPVLRPAAAPAGKPAAVPVVKPAAPPVAAKPSVEAQRERVDQGPPTGRAKGLTEEGRARLKASMAARWNDPVFRAKHAAAMAKKAERQAQRAG